MSPLVRLLLGPSFGSLRLLRLFQLEDVLSFSSVFVFRLCLVVSLAFIYFDLLDFDDNTTFGVATGPDTLTALHQSALVSVVLPLLWVPCRSVELSVCSVAQFNSALLSLCLI